MTRTTAFLLIGLLTLAVGQSEDTQRVRLEPLNISLDLPLNASFSLTDKIVHIDLNPGGRQIRRCRLELLEGVPDIDVARTIHLTAELALSYSIEAFTGGSGGEEQILTGILQMPEALYYVESHDQAEFPAKPNPRLCLRYFASIAPIHD